MLGIPRLTSTSNTLVFNEKLSPMLRKGPELGTARVTNVWNITGIGLHGCNGMSGLLVILVA